MVVKISLCYIILSCLTFFNWFYKICASQLQALWYDIDSKTIQNFERCTSISQLIDWCLSLFLEVDRGSAFSQIMGQ